MEFSSERYHRMQSKLAKDDPARKLVYKPFYPGFLNKEKHLMDYVFLVVSKIHLQEKVKEDNLDI